jgi:hypothetical protein
MVRIRVLTSLGSARTEAMHFLPAEPKNVDEVSTTISTTRGPSPERRVNMAAELIQAKSLSDKHSGTSIHPSQGGKKETHVIFLLNHDSIIEFKRLR